jgi:hypothetical protein
MIFMERPARPEIKVCWAGPGQAGPVRAGSVHRAGRPVSRPGDLLQNARKDIFTHERVQKCTKTIFQMLSCSSGKESWRAGSLPPPCEGRWMYYIDPTQNPLFSSSFIDVKCFTCSIFDILFMQAVLYETLRLLLLQRCFVKSFTTFHAEGSL